MDSTNTITQINKGLHLDNSIASQPKGSYRFALNTINETNEGDLEFISNEESNEIYGQLPAGFTPIGKCYINNNEVALWLVKNDNTVSEIGILKDNGVYETHVNDSLSTNKLGFKIEHQIQATYRLRKGCERTVYFTDNNSRPRYYNFDKPQEFKNDTEWSPAKFNLFKEYSKIPKFEIIEVKNSGGQIEPGSVNISIQYVDENLNASEWILTSHTINIYNSLSTDLFLDINGSLNSDISYLDFPKTSKSIYIEISNLDTSYLFYRLAFIEANSGNGLVNSVTYTDVLSTKNTSFTYTGTNGFTKGTKEEILFFNDIIYKAGSIEQIENRLLLANTSGKDVDLCKLQQYASKINADMVLENIVANQIVDTRNTKSSIVHFGNMVTGGTGYMPGEMYSFGIVYVFEDTSLSPTFHIPGKSVLAGASTIFDTGLNTYPMGLNNFSVNTLYIDNETCSTNNYWGRDSKGTLLVNTPVRHHRFPLRSEVNIPLVSTITDTDNNPAVFTYYKIQFSATGSTPKPVSCTALQLAANPPCVPVIAPSFQAKLTYTVDGVTKYLYMSINTSINNDVVNIINFSEIYTTNNIVIVKIEELNTDPNLPDTDVTTGISPKGLVYTASINNLTSVSQTKEYQTQIMGIKFSNIELPKIEDSGQKIIGYYIVRNERLDTDKTILDSAVLLPMINHNNYVGQGLLSPDLDYTRVNSNVFGLLHPEHKFNDTRLSEIDYIKQEGSFVRQQVNKSKIALNDVMDGSSYDESIDDISFDNDDSNPLDGWSLKIIVRDTILNFVKTFQPTIVKAKIKKIFYLDALESREINNGANTVFNVAGDNKIGILQTENATIDLSNGQLPYVILGRDLQNVYSDFRTRPYYKESINMHEFNTTGTSTTSIFNGDTYVTPMRYLNSIFWKNRTAFRAINGSEWGGIFTAILVIAAVVVNVIPILGQAASLAIITTGLATTLTIGAIAVSAGLAASLIASGLKKDNLFSAYNDEYGKGLINTVYDTWMVNEYQYGSQVAVPSSPANNAHVTPLPNDYCGYDGGSDDEIQWAVDCVTDLWFESTINMSLRNKFVDKNDATFLDAPGIIETGNNSAELCGSANRTGHSNLHYWMSINRAAVSKLEKHILTKFLVFDDKRKNSKAYIGHSLGEYYNVNSDYHRINKEKIFYHLPLEYDCCSNCNEKFPHRIRYSEQSFQEELSDNYRTFLPNNYKDIQGETGEIKNVFKINNDLFIHTTEALYNLPRSYQERVTDQIVSFIGTGSFFEIPPQKLLDDDTGSSAGTQHKWSSIKTPNGYFFVCENQRKIYQFDGKQLKPISDNGLSNWFKNNLPLKVNQEIYNRQGKDYRYNDNPSNLYGAGFISTYDSQKERIIFTKKDYWFQEFNYTDFEIVSINGSLYIFNNITQTINDQLLDGWIYTGIVNNQMTFEKEVQINTPTTTYFPVFTPVTDTQCGAVNMSYGIFCGYQQTGTITLSAYNCVTNQIDTVTKNIITHSNPSLCNIDGLGGLDYSTAQFVTLSGCYKNPVYTRTGTFPANSDAQFISSPINIGESIFTCTIITLEPVITNVITTSKIYQIINPVALPNKQINYSWTISYSLKNSTWTSWHSYIPNFYINVPEKFYSFIYNNNNLWKHNKKGSYGNFYGVQKDFILEYISLSSPLTTRIWEEVMLLVETKKYQELTQEYIDVSDTFFNKLIAYNSAQCTGELTMIVKDNEDDDYLGNQIQNLNINEIIVDRNERNWTINELRDIRSNYNVSIFDSNILSLQNNYYIDKILNISSLDYNKQWYELEMMRDKFLALRFIFNNVSKTNQNNIKMLVNYSIENDTQSFR